jgi:DNA polymerase-3 subunit gamma/tau
MSLYHKHRPASLDEVVGNEETVRAVKADFSKKDPPRAVLLDGPTGCGKTTIGRIIAGLAGAEGEDFREIDSADFRGIDTIRDIRRSAMFRPLDGGKARAWLLDEAHQLSNDAQAALLKGLEDPPVHAFFILATTDPQKLLSTIRGRCAQYSVRPLRPEEMLRLLRRVVKAENETMEREVYEQIAQDSEGLPRGALQILDQVLTSPKEKRLEVAKRKGAEQSKAIDLCRALLECAGWKKVSTILSGLRDSEDPERIRRSVLGYMASLLIKGEDSIQAGCVLDEFKEPFYASGWPGLVLACYSVVKADDDKPPF